VLLQVPPGWEGAWAGVAGDLRLVLSVLANTRVLLQVRLAGKAETAGCAMEVALSLVVHRASVVLEGALVAEGRRADVAVEHVASVSCEHVSGQAGFPRERRIARVTLVRLVRRVGLHVAGQCLLVLELHTALGARVGIGVVAVMELFMDGEMVFSGESFGAVSAIELVILLVSPLVPSQAVAPFEGLSALATHVFAVICVAVHVACQVLFHPGCVFTKRTSQLGWTGFAFPAPLLQRGAIHCGAGRALLRNGRRGVGQAG